MRGPSSSELQAQAKQRLQDSFSSAIQQFLSLTVNAPTEASEVNQDTEWYQALQDFVGAALARNISSIALMKKANRYRIMMQYTNGLTVEVIY